MKRPAELRATVERLLAISDGQPVELVVADASPVGQQLDLIHPRLTVALLDFPGGVDADYDKAISVASGRYCWLFTDDDCFDGDVIQEILRSIASEDLDHPSLVLVNARVTDSAGELLRESMLGADAPRMLAASASACEFAPLAELLTYIGSVVILRAIWMGRRSGDFVGSEFRHVGLILSSPLPGRVIVLQKAMITVRYGVAHWESRSLRVWTTQWPDVIRQSVANSDQWELFFVRSTPRLVLSAVNYRARGLLSRETATQFFPTERTGIRNALFTAICALPVAFARILVLAKAKVSSGDHRMLRFELDRTRTLR